jgi:hypothetical protein
MKEWFKKNYKFVFSGFGLLVIYPLYWLVTWLWGLVSWEWLRENYIKVIVIVLGAIWILVEIILILRQRLKGGVSDVKGGQAERGEEVGRYNEYLLADDIIADIRSQPLIRRQKVRKEYIGDKVRGSGELRAVEGIGDGMIHVKVFSKVCEYGFVVEGEMGEKLKHKREGQQVWVMGEIVDINNVDDEIYLKDVRLEFVD